MSEGEGEDVRTDKDLKAVRIGFNSESRTPSQQGQQTAQTTPRTSDHDQNSAPAGEDLTDEENEVRDDEGKVWATANPATNTLWVRVPEDKEKQIAIAAAMVAIEEFLHGEWIVAIMYQLAHLEHAANRALARNFTEETELGDQRALQIVVSCQRTIQQLMTAIEPFVEAVDKFQHHHTIKSDDDYINDIVDDYAQNHGEQDTKEFERQLEYRIENDWELAVGKGDAADDTSYVNPAYFRALYHLIKQWETDDETGDSERGRGRAIAEAVARATLDIPQPIAPLGGEQFPGFEPLSPMGDGPDPITYEGLSERYPVTEDEFDRFQSRFVEGGGLEEDIMETDLIPDEGWSGLSYDDAQESWVLRAFINVCHTLGDIEDEDDSNVDLSDPDVETLREELVAKVHGVDVDDYAETMQNCATALLDYPRQQAARSEEEGDDAQFVYPLETIFEKSFNSHGMFGVVIYHQNDGATDHIPNWHVADTDFALSEEPADTDNKADNGTNENAFALDAYPHVSDGCDSYKAHWEEHWYWNHVRYHILDAYQTYRAKLIDMLKDKLGTKTLSDELQRASVEVRRGLQNTPTEFENLHDIASREHVQEIAVENRSAGILKKTAEKNDIDTEIPSVAFDDLECPLCEIREIPAVARMGVSTTNSVQKSRPHCPKSSPS
ncbi:hypothetical protein VB773_19725 [Haloarculaceae archaeon H-GB2-1]|nr:hypothetical protein [Haloarculaceae archaeon H-GB2-1]